MSYPTPAPAPAVNDPDSAVRLHPAIRGVLNHFDGDPGSSVHGKAYEAWQDFSDFAHQMAIELRDSGPEVVVALRHLLSARDSVVRAHQDDQRLAKLQDDFPMQAVPAQRGAAEVIPEAVTMPAPAGDDGHRAQ